MSFAPLPEPLTDRCRQLASISQPVILDLGCGEGHLGRSLGKLGLPVIGLDRMPPWLGSTANVAGDALAPCVRSGCCDLILAGNLVRHLLRSDNRAAFLNTWQGLLKPGGTLILLEDQPDRKRSASRNYAEVQDFLVTISAGRRGPLLKLERFQELVVTATGDHGWTYGLKNNRWPVEQENVVTLLQGQGGNPGPIASRLIANIRKHGLQYGQYWWACWQAPGRSER